MRQPPTLIMVDCAGLKQPKSSGSGVNVARVAFTGLAGAWATPFLVMNAKFTYSTPVIAAQAGLSCWPVFRFCDRLSMLSAAHHCVAAQLLPAGHGAQPGG